MALIFIDLIKKVMIEKNRSVESVPVDAGADKVASVDRDLPLL